MTNGLADGKSRDIVANAVVAAGTLIGGARARLRSHGLGMVIPPARPGSMGDAAMLAAACAQFKENGLRHVTLVGNEPTEATSRYDAHIEGNGWFFDARRSELATLLVRASGAEAVGLVGADVLDGIYNPGSVIRRLDVLARCARNGARTAILGASFNDAPHADCLARLRALPEAVTIYARDPISGRRFETMLDRAVSLTADVAFLTPHDPSQIDAAAALRWIDERRSARTPVVALNANYLLGQRVQGYGDAHAALLAALMREGIGVLLVPHDARTSGSDEAILSAARRVAGLDDSDLVHMLPPRTPHAIAATLAQCDLLVTGRMHAAILAATGSTPAFAFAYQGKFEGLYDLLELDRSALLAAPEDLATEPRGTARRIIDALEAAGRHRQILERTVPGMQVRARRNFDFLRGS